MDISVIKNVGTGVLDGPVILQRKITSSKVIMYFPDEKSKNCPNFWWTVREAGPYIDLFKSQFIAQKETNYVI